MDTDTYSPEKKKSKLNKTRRSLEKELNACVMDKEQAGQFCKTHNGPALNCWIYSDFEDEKENQLYTPTQSPERPLEDDITVMYDSDDEARSQQCKVASLCLFNKYFHGNCSNELFVNRKKTSVLLYRNYRGFPTRNI